MEWGTDGRRDEVLGFVCGFDMVGLSGKAFVGMVSERGETGGERESFLVCPCLYPIDEVVVEDDEFLRG